jgi:signal transduction histidine kinase
MSLFGPHRWFLAAAGISLTFAGIVLVASRGPALVAFADIFETATTLALAAIVLSNAVPRSKPERSFWVLMGVGCCLWGISQGTWTYYEVVRRSALPDPCSADIVLFFHLVPMIVAISLRPDRLKRESRFQVSTLNSLMLLVWWIFLYAFIVFPPQYIQLDVAAYNRYYDRLYVVESLVFLAALGFAAWTSSGDWKRIYANFLGAGLLYAVASQLIDRAVTIGTYQSGSLYDVPLLAATCWMAATAASARRWQLNAEAAGEESALAGMTHHLAALAILSLPMLGLWTLLADQSPVSARLFRLSAVLGAMLVLGAFVFLRQYGQDQALMRLLGNSREGYEAQRRLQAHLVQKEKLASLGQLVAGAAHEINHPLAAIMQSSEQLWSGQHLAADQDSLVRKIFNQAQRTRELVSDLLRFAQQTPGEKNPVDLGLLISRGAQMLEARHASGRIRVQIQVEPNLPPVFGNANQLFQSFVEIIENAMDALEDSREGLLQIGAQKQNNEVLVLFSDNGPGIREPERVFDPFYTTKPVGKGTGLGLSAVYGVIQDHGGQITCWNKTGGGALFLVRLPAAAELAARAAGAQA